MDFRFDLCKISVKHSIEDGATNCQNVLCKTNKTKYPKSATVGWQLRSDDSIEACSP